MTRPIIDAGPALNFFAANRERLLISVLGKISAPEIVIDEVRGKAQSDRRFRPAAPVLNRLLPDWWRSSPTTRHRSCRP